jgi:hypothetical protein
MFGNCMNFEKWRQFDDLSGHYPLSLFSIHAQVIDLLFVGSQQSETVPECAIPEIIF